MATRKCPCVKKASGKCGKRKSKRAKRSSKMD